MNNRLPYILLGILVLLALIVRLASPPPPPPPGPVGAMPGWNAMTKVGDMGPWEVNPAGSMWAGAWNLKTKAGKLRSAVWIIDFEKADSRPYVLKDGSFVSSLSWADDGAVRALTVDTENPAVARKSEVLLISASTAKLDRTVPLTTPVARILAWPAGSDRFVAELAGSKDKATLAIMTGTGEISGKSITTELPADTNIGRIDAMGKAGDQFVFTVVEDQLGGKQSYYLADAKTGTAKRAFGSEGLPGRVQGLWISPAGILAVTSERDKFHTLVCDPATGKINEVGKAGFVTDVKKNWPDAPASMMFVSYTAGYQYDLATAKTKKLFEFDKSNRSDERWQREVQDGRMYSLKNGDYASVSYLAGTIDIRTISKDGMKGQPLLPRS